MSCLLQGLAPDIMSAMLDLESDVPVAEWARNRTYLAGSTVLRATDLEERLVVGADGQQVDVADENPVTLEGALFPFLFSDGGGWCTDCMTMLAYLKMRMQSLFSVYTLFLPYLLVMIQVCNKVAALAMHHACCYCTCVNCHLICVQQRLLPCLVSRTNVGCLHLCRST
jgi:hypothetical protein